MEQATAASHPVSDHPLGPDAAAILASEHWSLLGFRSLIWNEALSRTAVVEGHKHRVDGRHRRLRVALAGGVDRALADRLGVASGHAEPVAGEGLAQRRPGGAQLLGGGVDAAQSLG